MKLFSIILSEVLEYNLDYNREVEKIKNKKGKYLGSGDYGSVYDLRGKAVKITTDGLELDHAEKLLRSNPTYFAHVYKVIRINDNLGIIEMEKLNKTDRKPSEDFLGKLEEEARKYNIDPEELDYNKDNFMEDSNGNLKMIDV